MKREFTKGELILTLNARAQAGSDNLTAKGISFNSKELKPGEIFVALAGESRHGHDFVENAFQTGAALAIVEDDKFLSDPRFSDRILVVPDTLGAFWRLGQLVRSEFKGRVAAVVGSVGKTTTKELLGSLASQFIKCDRSLKSFNNMIGVPYTICNNDLDSELWVLELGMNHVGELAKLSELAKPHLALLTQIAPEHMEFFSSLSEVADAEFEVLSGLADDGYLLIAADDVEAEQALSRNQNRWNRNSITVSRFGSGTRPGGPSVTVSQFRHTVGPPMGSQFVIAEGSDAHTVQTALIGEHNAKNFCGAVLALRTLFPKVTLEEISQVASKIEPPPMRLNQLTLADGTLVIDDTYNSSPSALSAAIGILKELKQGGASVALVIGDMRELGAESARYHLEVVPSILELEPEYVVTFGEFSEAISNSLEKQGVRSKHARSIEEVKELTRKTKVDIVLFKASRGIGLDRAVKALL